MRNAWLNAAAASSHPRTAMPSIAARNILGNSPRPGHYRCPPPTPRPAEVDRVIDRPTEEGLPGHRQTRPNDVGALGERPRWIPLGHGERGQHWPPQAHRPVRAQDLRTVVVAASASASPANAYARINSA